MKRKDIKGTTIKIFNYYFEIVTIKNIPRILTISKNKIEHIKRFEI